MPNSRMEKKASTDPSQVVNIALEDIVPEYVSRNRLVRWLFNRRLSVAVDYLKTVNHKSLVDIGCGDGSFIQAVNRSLLKIESMWGIDVNPFIVDLERKINNCNFRRESILGTDFHSGTFDVAVCLDVLEHIEEVNEALSEIRRILTERGHLITSMPVESVLYKSLRFVLKGTYSSETGPGAGKHYYSAKELDDFIGRVGFERIASRKIPLPFPFDLFHVNLYQKKT